MAVIPAIADVWRDYETSGVPASGAHQPSKPEIRATLTDMDNRIAAAVASTSLVYATRASLFSNLAPAAGSRAEVRGDSTLGYNGIYTKTGASGAGGWTRIADLPDGVVRLNVTGGTANAIEAAPSPQLPVTKGNKLYLLRPTTTNTGAVTIDDGSGPVAIKSVFGNELAAGALLIDTENVLVWTLDHYQLLIAASVDASSILADAQAAAVTATDAAATIDLPAVEADTFVVGNSAGTARINAIPAEARAILQVPSFDELPYLVATENGVPGDGSDQTVALQALADSLPTEGGNILYAGTVLTSSLDMHERRNIRFIGLGGNGAGAGQRSIIQTAAGAGAGRIIDCRGSTNISFERCYLYAPNAAFDGTLIDFGFSGGAGGGAASFDDCLLYVEGAAATGLGLYGSYTGSWERTTFSGGGTLVGLQTTGGVGFCNVHNFRSCNFTPKNQYPIAGSGEAISFVGCNWQAGSSDHIGRALQGSTEYPFRSLTLVGCAFYDATVTGGTWFQIPWGGGIGMFGGRMGGSTSGTSYGFDLGGHAETGDPETGGVGGVSIFGADFQHLTAVVALSGDASDKSNVRGVVTGGNRLTVADMYSNLASAQDVVNLGNRVYGSGKDFASGFSLSGTKEYADRSAASGASLVEGRVFIATGTSGHRVLEIV